MFTERPEISVVVPVYQEEASIPVAFPHFLRVLAGQRRSFELIAVNDGSRDRSGGLLDELAANEPRLRVIHLARNYGQTAAMMAGIWAARAPITVPLDGDGQNPPEEIERLCDILEQGNYDVVSGWRKDRQDPWLRTQVSRVANWLIGKITGVRLHDYGCTLKAYRTQVIRDARLYGEMHRFIPVYTSMHGARICEVVVRHNPRRAGTSKYGYGRIAKVAVDLILVRMLQKYRTKPMHFFGRITQWSWLAAGFFVLLGVYRAITAGDAAKLLWGKAPLVAVIFFVLGSFSILLGLVAELAMRAAFEHNAGRYWEEGRRVNFEIKGISSIICGAPLPADER
ncbi:MAG: glycosyltransferase family 2 protein [Planctomycetota bacterium]